VKTFHDPQGPVHVEPGEAFTLALPGNPTTGYTRDAIVSSEELELVGHDYRPEGTALGGGGHELFTLRARAAGTFEIGFTYRRPWGGPVRATRRIHVVAGPDPAPGAQP